MPDNDPLVLDMYGRIANLETQAGIGSSRLERGEAKLESIAERLTRLEEKVAHLPTKELILKVAVGTTTLIISVVGFLVTLAPKLQSLVGNAGPH